MRVIGGSARGRRLVAPPGRDVRPTSDRVREALFSSIAAAVPGARVLDLFAGSGALAVEALSRGAAHAVLVERSGRAAAVARRNLGVAGVADRATVRRIDATAFCRAPTGGPFDVVLADPPYAEPLARIWTLLATLHRAGGVAPGGVVVVERDRRDPDLEAPPPPTLARVLAFERRRTYGDTVLLYLRPQEPST
jgi:16S rRNA (guanine966-N2)-methyltransferase